MMPCLRADKSARILDKAGYVVQAVSLLSMIRRRVRGLSLSHKKEAQV